MQDKSKRKFVIAITGGGSEVFAHILKHGGASSWFLDGLIPYSSTALDKLILFKPEKYSSALTARQMAMAAFDRARWLGAELDEAVGVGCTATLVKTDGERAGRKHHFHIAFQTSETTGVFSNELLENRSREAEEGIVSTVLTNLVDYLRGEPARFAINASKAEKEVIKSTTSHDTFGLKQIVLPGSHGPNIYKTSTGRDIVPGDVVYPGSFNPLHEGHISLVEAASKLTGKKVYLELSVLNVDKPQLDYIDLDNRFMSIVSKYNKDTMNGVVFSDAATFVEKIHLYPIRTQFLIGADTLIRLFDEKYGSVEYTLESASTKGAGFLVGNRPGFDLTEYKAYKGMYQHLFTFLPDFEGIDISSTTIRGEKENDN